MTHRSDTPRGTSRRERRSRGREERHQHHRGQRQPPESQVQQQLPQQQMQQQSTPSYASSSGYTANGGYAGYAIPQGGQYQTPGYDAQGYPQAPSTPRAHQGSAHNSQYSPDRDNTRVRLHGDRDYPEDPALRTESFVQEGHRHRVASSRSSQSGRDIQREREDSARDAIAGFYATYGDANTQSSHGPAQYYPNPDYPDCGDGPNHGGSSYGGH
ncbi:hypothetical protein LCI18_007265 [Fusarium solani-melongenae]|uniref:Uncharacterized protein n=1 Tax=Fusarium solani subsp. cucurbitae TaxID=2747967 RepID=A0ACD3Z541_FUSSC|nr:hypothetical protein LCI18_007265 [Fusarium solani-melongenae]